MKTTLRWRALVPAMALGIAACPPSVGAQPRLSLMPVLLPVIIPSISDKGALSYRSIFDSYKPYTDEKTVAWKAANDEVGRIGGWRAYLKEANEPEPMVPIEPKSTSDKNGVSAPSQTPAKTPSRNPHAGHGGQ